MLRKLLKIWLNIKKIDKTCVFIGKFKYLRVVSLAESPKWSERWGDIHYG